MGTLSLGYLLEFLLRGLVVKNMFNLLVLVFIASFLGCGGSGSSTSTDITPTSDTLSGVAAVGSPIANGIINVSCAAGSVISSTTDSAGAWTVNLQGQTLPCAVQVSGGTINGIASTTSYHSIAITTGTVNVTPLTDLIVANLAGTATPSNWFAGVTTTPSQLTAFTQTQVDASLVHLRNAFSGLTPLSTINPITTAFTAVAGNVSDDMLTALKTTMTNIGVSHPALLSNASLPTFTPVSGFDTALTNAYAGTTSGSTSSSTGTTGTNVLSLSAPFHTGGVASYTFANNVTRSIMGISSYTVYQYNWSTGNSVISPNYYGLQMYYYVDAAGGGDYLKLWGKGYDQTTQTFYNTDFKAYPMSGLFGCSIGAECTAAGITVNRVAGTITLNNVEFTSIYDNGYVAAPPVLLSGTMTFAPF